LVSLYIQPTRIHYFFNWS